MYSTVESGRELQSDQTVATQAEIRQSMTMLGPADMYVNVANIRCFNKDDLML